MSSGQRGASPRWPRCSLETALLCCTCRCALPPSSQAGPRVGQLQRHLHVHLAHRLPRSAATPPRQARPPGPQSAWGPSTRMQRWRASGAASHSLYCCAAPVHNVSPHLNAQAASLHQASQLADVAAAIGWRSAAGRSPAAWRSSTAASRRCLAGGGWAGGTSAGVWSTASCPCDRASHCARRPPPPHPPRTRVCALLPAARV